MDRDAVPGCERAEQVLACLAREVGPERVNRHFRGHAVLKLGESSAEVVTSTRFHADQIERRLSDPLRRALQAAGEPSGDLRFRVESSLNDPEMASPARRDAERGETRQTAHAAGRAAGLRGRTNGEPAPAVRAAKRSTQKRLEDFLTGESNRLAYGAAERVADPDGPGIDGPLFVHGACGVGKTHLLQGVAERYQSLRPGGRVRFVTADAFVHGFVEALRKREMSEFHRRHRAVDLLCIDDVHFFANKGATQTELVHTFDALDGRTRIVLASDEPPQAIAKLNRALISRFQRGAVVRLDPPEAGLRVRLVQTFAGRRGLRLSPEAAELLATPPENNRDDAQDLTARDLESLVTQVQALVSLSPDAVDPGGMVGASTALRALGSRSACAGSSSKGPSRPPTLDRIVRTVCSELEVELEAFRGTGRHKRVVLARGLAVHVAKSATTRSYPEIAAAMNRPNHSSVITAHNRVKGQIERGDRVQADCRHDGAQVRVLADLLVRRASEGG